MDEASQKEVTKNGKAKKKKKNINIKEINGENLYYFIATVLFAVYSTYA